MDCDARFQDTLQRHEERIEFLLETHKQQVIEELSRRLLLEHSDRSHSGRTQRRHRQQPPHRLLQSDGHHPSGSESLTGRRVSEEMSGVDVNRMAETFTAVEASLQSEMASLSQLNVVDDPRDCCSNAFCTPLRKCTTSIYKSRMFEMLISVAITVNAVLIGMFAEWNLNNIDKPPPLWYAIGSQVFLYVFTMELLVRWVTEGCLFLNCRNVNFAWNLFDCLMVVSTWAEVLLELLAMSGLNISFIRLARILRLMRVSRMLRVLSQFKELRIMVHGILNCGKPLLWASLLLGILAYGYVVLTLLVSSEWMRALPETPELGDADGTQATVAFILTNFGSLEHGMYTMLKCITGGVSWEEIADPMAAISPILIPAFLLYVLLGVACLLNLITAVFLEAAYERSQTEDARLLEHIEQKKKWLREAGLFFRTEFDLHFGGSRELVSGLDLPEVGLEDFTQVVQAPRIRAWFEEHGLDLYFEDPKSLFDLIDVDSNNRIDIHEFVAGLYRLKGGASALNLQVELQQVQQEVKKLKTRIATAHSDIISTVRSRVPDQSSLDGVASAGVGRLQSSRPMVTSESPRSVTSRDLPEVSTGAIAAGLRDRIEVKASWVEHLEVWPEGSMTSKIPRVAHF